MIFRSLLLIITLLISGEIYSKGKGESSILLKNGMLLNSTNLKGSVDIASSPNTFQQAIAYNYTYVTKDNVLLSAGVDAGYERYSLKMDYPFEEYGFLRPVYLHKNYERIETIPFVQANINVGYTFKGEKFKPELRIGQILHLPLKGEQFQYTSVEDAYFGLWDINYISEGSFGKASSAFMGELLNYIYVGGKFTSKYIGEKPIDIGLQLQKRLFLNKSGFSYYDITYFDNRGFVKGHQSFFGTHTSVSLVLGIAL